MCPEAQKCTYVILDKYFDKHPVISRHLEFMDIGISLELLSVVGRCESIHFKIFDTFSGLDF